MRTLQGLQEFKRNEDINKGRKYRKQKYSEEKRKTPPDNFSFINNTKETARFFNDVIRTRDSIKEPTSIFIDSKGVVKLEADALMYLIAVMYDTYQSKEKNVIFRGSVPQDKNAFSMFNRSGFTKYVQYKRTEIVPTTENIQICDGKMQDSKKAKEICQYIHRNSSLTRLDTMPLFELIVELMNNTIHHAYGDEYNNKEYTKNSWYLFSEKQNNKIIFVFLDTGLGIPRTVYRKWKERLNPMAKDSDYIKTALLGEFRTETQKRHRGKGLPQILKNCQSGLISNAFVYSGKGCCKINEKCDSDDGIEAYEADEKINGTLFSWEILI